MRNTIPLVLILLFFEASFVAAAEIHPMGLNWKDPRIAAPSHQIMISRSKDVLPVRLDHSADMPPVGNQASQGSCTAWATAYYHKSYQEWAEHGWSLTDQNHQFSPAFVYNQINGGGDYGSWFGDAFQLLCDMGGSSMALTPYNDADCISWPSEAAYDSAISYRCQDWFWFDLYDSLGIEGIKQCLNNGDNVVIGLLVYKNYDNISAYDNIFCLADLSGDIRGGHANCIVGYDDSLLTRDGYGAFRVVNSWGASWGDRGYYWMSYGAAIDGRTSYQAAFYSSDKIGYRPSLKLRARIKHDNRGSVRIKAGTGPSSAPDWEREFFVNSYDGYTFGGGNHPFPDNNVVLDVTDGAASLDSLGRNNLFLMTQDLQTDGVAGTVEYLSAENSSWNAQNASLETPDPIYDDQSCQYTDVSLFFREYRLTVTPTEGSLDLGDSLTITILLNNVNGFDHPVCLGAQFVPSPGAGSLQVDFERSAMIPDDSCQAQLFCSPDIDPGQYSIVITGIDSIDTLIRHDTLELWVLGNGQAMCVGSTQEMINLARTHWGKVDSMDSLPPLIGDSYRTLILENNLSPADTLPIREFIAGGGQVLSVGRTIYDLCQSTSLLPLSQWLGASGFAWYTGTGIAIVSDYQNPFGIPNIDYGDSLGTLTADNGRLANILPGAVPLAHLGTASSAIAALYNAYGSGKSLWLAAGAGFSEPMDSLISGYFGNPALGISDDPGEIYSSGITGPDLSVYPSPFKGAVTLRLNIPGISDVKATVYDICGRRVRKIFEGKCQSGASVFNWNGKDEAGTTVSAGIYFIKAETDYGSLLKKTISIR